MLIDLQFISDRPLVDKAQFLERWTLEEKI